MSGTPKIRLIVQAHKSRVRGTCSKDSHARELLIQGPCELVHVNIGVELGGIEGERNAGNSALLVHHRLETSQVGEGGKHWAVLIRGHVALELKGHKTCQACVLVPKDKATYGLGGDIAAAQIVVALIVKVAACIGRVGFPVVGRPTVAPVAVQGEMWLRVARIEIGAVNVR